MRKEKTENNHKQRTASIINTRCSKNKSQTGQEEKKRKEEKNVKDRGFRALLLLFSLKMEMELVFVVDSKERNKEVFFKKKIQTTCKKSKKYTIE